MNRKLLLSLQKKNQTRAAELQTRAEDPTVSAEDLKAIQDEAKELADEAKKVSEALAELDKAEGDKSDETDKESDEPADTTDSADEEEKSEDDEDKEEKSETPKDNENRDGVSGSQIVDILKEIRGNVGMNTGTNKKVKDQQVRSAFANFVVGKISEKEARDLGIVTGNGSVTVPEVVAKEIITYAQEENLLRKYGTVVQTAGDVKYPVLVKKANANVNKNERGKDAAINDEAIEFDEILLDPAEFDALATVTKKLIKMSGVNIEQIVVDELKKAYVRKEANYMFNGDDEGNENPGALAKKAVEFTPSVAVTDGPILYDALVELKNAPASAVVKKARFIMNRAALTMVEKMKTSDGLPLLRPMTQAEGGIGNSLVGFPIDFTDDADDKTNKNKAVFYFGDFKSFHIQDVQGAMEIQKLTEKYADTNRLGYKIYNLLDGQLVYSPLEPTMYKFTLAPVVKP